MRVNDVADLRHQTVHPPPYYVEQILPKEGVLLMFGGPKIGKSYMAKQLAFSLATGQDFLGFRTLRARVMVVQFEISYYAYQYRLRTIMDSSYPSLENGWLYELSPGLIFMDEREGYERVREEVRPIEPEVIILDCLQSCFGGDENDSRDIGRFIGKVEELKQENRASIVLVHHSRKSPSVSSFADLARGQSRLTGWPDTLMYMHKIQGSVQLQFMARQATRELENISTRFNNGVFVRR